MTAPLPSEFSLESRVALVTGGSRGLGLAIAAGLVRHGATVVLSARKEPELEVAAAGLESIRAGSATYVASHAGRPDEIESLVARVMERHGRVDLLVNNAGTNPYFGPLLDADAGAWDKTFEVNVRGYFLLTQACWRAWMRDHGGAVLNVASTAGVRPAPMMGIYGITKAAVIMLTRQLASELGGRSGSTAWRPASSGPGSPRRCGRTPRSWSGCWRGTRPAGSESRTSWRAPPSTCSRTPPAT